LLKTLSLSGVNAATRLSFYPAGGFSNPGYNKTVECPPGGTDADCDGDKYEACVLSEYCNGVSCAPDVQLKLANFLQCFESEHASVMSAADGCLAAAGFSVSIVRKCFDGAGKAAAWKMVQSAAAPHLPSIKCFPWIEVAGTVESKDYQHGCFGVNAAKTPLLPLICKAAIQGGVTPPDACARI